MRSNSRPAMALSALAPDQVSLRPGEAVAIACPFCGRWRRVKRHMLWPHRAHDGTTRCPGSGQRVVIDLTPGQWAARLDTARRSVRRLTSLQRSTMEEIRRARAAQRQGGSAA